MNPDSLRNFKLLVLDYGAFLLAQQLLIQIFWHGWISTDHGSICIRWQAIAAVIVAFGCIYISMEASSKRRDLKAAGEKRQ